MQPRAPRVTIFAFLLLACSAAAARATVAWDSEVTCDIVPVAGHFTTRGFYIGNYPGTNLSQVALQYRAVTGTAGYRSITLTAHRATYDGPRIGTPQTATVILPEAPGAITVVFDFGGAPVAPGDTIAFTHEAQTLNGVSGQTLYLVGSGSCPRVHETLGTSPPLDSPSPNQVIIAINQRHVTTDCVPSPTRLCIDDQPGDHRYRATLFFHTSQADGISGDAQAIPLSDNGVVHGGLFWFFGQDDPEVTLKILPACGLNSHHWVYFVAGTNVGYTLTIRDMVTGQQKVYTNDDLHQATPVGDVNAFSCP